MGEGTEKRAQPSRSIHGPYLHKLAIVDAPLCNNVQHPHRQTSQTEISAAYRDLCRMC